MKFYLEGDDKHSSNYDFENASSVTDVNNSDTFGQFSINGALIDVSGNGSSFEVDEYSSQVISFSYDLSESDFTDVDDEWHLIDDNSKVIGDIQTEQKIKYGATL